MNSKITTTGIVNTGNKKSCQIMPSSIERRVSHTTRNENIIKSLKKIIATDTGNAWFFEELIKILSKKKNIPLSDEYNAKIQKILDEVSKDSRNKSFCKLVKL